MIVHRRHVRQESVSTLGPSLTAVHAILGIPESTVRLALMVMFLTFNCVILVSVRTDKDYFFEEDSNIK